MSTAPQLDSTRFLAPSSQVTCRDEKVVEFPGQRESSLVRTVGMMALQGLSAHEIAHVLQKPVELVTEMFNDPNLQVLFAREIEAKGKYALKKFVSSAAVDVVAVLRSIVNNPQAKNSDRISAGRELLDRGFGKPSPAHKHGDHDDDGWVGDNPEETLAKLRAEVDAKLKDREKLLQGKQVS